MLTDLKRLFRSLKPAQLKTTIELNDTETANVLKSKNSIRRRFQSFKTPEKPKNLIVGGSFRRLQKTYEPKCREKATDRSHARDRTVYQNVPQTPTATPSKFTAYSADFSPSAQSGEVLDYERSGFEPEAVLEETLRADQVSVYSFAVDPTKIFEQDVSAVVASSGIQDSNDQFAQMIGDCSFFVKVDVQSSAEAYNEYIRMKHTKTVLDKMVHFYEKRRPGKITVQLQQLSDFVAEAMSKLRSTYPHLQAYVHSRGNRRLNRRQLSQLTEEHNVAEYMLM